MKIQKVFKPVIEFDEIDITKALTTSGRILYPKIAKKTRIDDFLARRTHLKLLEERRFQTEKLKEIANKLIAPKNEDEGDVDVEGTEENASSGRTDATPLTPSGKPTKIISSNSKELLAVIGKRLKQVQAQYASLTRLGGKNVACYSRYCNLATQNLTNKTVITQQSLATNCYSPTCLRKMQLKRDLVGLLRKVNALNNNANAAETTTSVATAATQSDPVKTESNEIKTEIKTEQKSIATVSPNDSDGSPQTKKIKLEQVRNTS